ncbi:unnamed protein product [Linum trigynum]|uniref:Uncharacterized protein n=1 Tax=Linum trigynum TaxID=586398 RepID=A0AAV2D972_9ROSI
MPSSLHLLQGIHLLHSDNFLPPVTCDSSLDDLHSTCDQPTTLYFQTQDSKPSIVFPRGSSECCFLSNNA